MSIRDTTKSRGRPATGKGTPITLRLQTDQLTALDRWIAQQPKPAPSRPEAIRALLRLGLGMEKNSSDVEAESAPE